MVFIIVYENSRLNIIQKDRSQSNIPKLEYKINLYKITYNIGFEISCQTKRVEILFTTKTQNATEQWL